jgi:hypothetical protein
VPDEMPSDPFREARAPDLEHLSGSVAGFYLSLQARGVPEQRAAEFTTTFLQTWIPYIMMAASQQHPEQQQGETPQE